MLRRFEHTIVLGIAIELSMVIAFGALLLAPRWKLLAFAPTGRADYQHVQEWSPDGASLLMEGPGGFEVLTADGSVLLHEELRRELSVVWVDARTLLILEYASPSTYRLFRVNTGDGRRQMIGGPMAQGFLTADGRGGVAHRSGDGPLTTTVLDPVDGDMVAELVGYRPVTWTNDGSLILGQPKPRLEGSDVAGERLSYWRPGEAPRRLGPDLLDVGTDAPVSPSGDVIACVCVEESSLSGVARPEIYQVPIDGSRPTNMASWHTSGSTSPEMTWLDETSLAVIDNDGLSLVSVSGGRRIVPGLAASDLAFTKMIGRVYPLRDGALAILRDQTNDTVDTLLVVIDAQYRIAMRRRLDTHTLTDIAIDRVNERIVVSGDPQYAFGPQTELFILEFN